MYVNLPKFQRKHYDDSNQGNMVREKDKQMATQSTTNKANQTLQILTTRWMVKTKRHLGVLVDGGIEIREEIKAEE